MDVRAALAAATARLADAGVPEPRTDAEVLVAAALATDRASVIVRAREPLPPPAAARLHDLLAARVGRTPVAHLLGEREFWSMPFVVDRRVLIPRPETELIVETACRLVPGARRALDLGTGSGAIAAALARELPGARVWASDREADALAVARENLRRHAPRVALVRADWLSAFNRGCFDLIVANPPYIPDADMAGLAPEVRDHEPRTALSGGPDGLCALRKILAQAADTLVEDGWLVMEMGAGQAQEMRRAVGADGRYADPIVECDLAGIERVIAVRRRGAE
jgi:release factor glutamine methyltransferase